VKRQKVIKEGEIERAIELAKRRPSCRAIVVVLDADDDCPKQLAPELLQRASTAGQGTHVSVVLAKMEMESWFIGSIESLRGYRGVSTNAAVPPEPEAIRDAKGYLTRVMQGSQTYLSVDDQPAFTARFDIRLAYEKCRSFRKFRDDFCRIVSSIAAGEE
jgi:nitroreductase